MKTYEELKLEHAINNGYASWAELYYDNPPNVIDKHYEYVAYAFMREVANELIIEAQRSVNEALEVEEPLATEKERKKKNLLQALKPWKK